jgi:hypothetical protein
MNITAALEAKTETLFMFADYMMKRDGVTAEQMTLEVCTELAAIFIKNAEWITEAHIEALTQLAAQ